MTSELQEKSLLLGQSFFNEVFLFYIFSLNNMWSGKLRLHCPKIKSMILQTSKLDAALVFNMLSIEIIGYLTILYLPQYHRAGIYIWTWQQGPHLEFIF